MARRRQTRSRGRHRGRHDARRLIGIIAAVVGVLCVFGAFYGVYKVSRIPDLQVRFVEVRGGKTIPHSRIEKVVYEVLQEEGRRFMPRTFAYALPYTDLSAAVHDVSRVDKVAFSRRSAQTLRVDFTEYTPHALWCSAEADNVCYFIDKTGEAYLQAPDIRGTTYVRYVFVDTEPEKYQSFPERALIEYTDTLQKLLAESYPLVISAVTVTADGDVKIDLIERGYLLVTRDTPPTRIFALLDALLQDQAYAHLKYDDFKYIDLRFGARLYVNEHGAPDVATSTATSTTSSQ